MFLSNIFCKDVFNYLVFVIIGFFYDLIRILVKILCDRNVIVFVVGVGDDYDEEEFREISSSD